jgi:hypothetical protein
MLVNGRGICAGRNAGSGDGIGVQKRLRLRINVTSASVECDIDNLGARLTRKRILHTLRQAKIGYPDRALTIANTKSSPISRPNDDGKS